MKRYWGIVPVVIVTAGRRLDREAEPGLPVLLKPFDLNKILKQGFLGCRLKSLMRGVEFHLIIEPSAFIGTFHVSKLNPYRTAISVAQQIIKLFCSYFLKPELTF